MHKKHTFRKTVSIGQYSLTHYIGEGQFGLKYDVLEFEDENQGYIIPINGKVKVRQNAQTDYSDMTEGYTDDDLVEMLQEEIERICQATNPK